MAQVVLTHLPPPAANQEMQIEIGEITLGA